MKDDAMHADEMDDSLELIAAQFKANVEVKDRKYRFQVGARRTSFCYNTCANFASRIFIPTRHTATASLARRRSIT